MTTITADRPFAPKRAAVNPDARCDHRHSRSRSRRTVSLAVITGVLVATIGSYAARGGGSGGTEAMETLFTDAVQSRTSRLTSAREAARRDDREMAVHDYLSSIAQDASSAEAAVDEMVKLLLSAAEAHRSADRHLQESEELRRCYQALLQLKDADAATGGLPGPARAKLFANLAAVRSAGGAAAGRHVRAADELRRQAKGRWNDDEDKQADALHRVNLAWSYYPSFTDDATINGMYELWADLKGELPSWRYERVLERDRLQLGRVVGDRS